MKKKQLITNGATALSSVPEAATNENNGATAPETRENVIEFPKAAESGPAPQPAVAPSTAGDRFEMVAMTAIYESRTNPRRLFDEAGLNELAESIRRQGLVTPLTLRDKPVDNTALLYEIIAGARRFRASARAGLSEVPAVIKSNVSDAAVIELQLVENLLRQDLNPMEEAQGYAELMAMGYDPKEIGEKVRKSWSWVYQQVQLLKLIEPAQQALYAGELVRREAGQDVSVPFTRNHGVEIARLQAEDQAKALEQMKAWIGSVRDLKRWIQQNVTLKLDKAPFPTENAELLPAAGACTTCPKRTGANQELFADLVAEQGEDVCTDKACFVAKVQAFVQLQATTVEKETGKPALKVSMASFNVPEGVVRSGDYVIIGEKGRAKCDLAVKAVVVDGAQIGQTLEVCADKKCKRHFKGSAAPARKGESEKEREKRLAAEKEGEDRRQKELATARERERQGKLERDKAASVKERIVDAVAGKVGGKLERRDTLAVTAALLLYAPWGVPQALAKTYGVKETSGQVSTKALFDRAQKMKEQELNQFLARAAALTYLTTNSENGANLKSLAAQYKIDLAAVTKQVEAEFAARNKKSMQASARRVAPQPKSKTAR
jgi:ParB family chromosome partitioning protein